MKKFMTLLIASGLALLINESVNGQSRFLANKLDKAIQKNNEKNKEKATEKKVANMRENLKSVSKSAFQQENIGKVLFAKGIPNADGASAISPTQSVNLTEPSFLNVYLEDPLYNIAIKNGINEIQDKYGFNRNYFINGVLILNEFIPISEEKFLNKIVFNELIVPSSPSAFKDRAYQVGSFSHVFSCLTPGTYKLKVVYTVPVYMKNKEGKSGYQPVEVASGEVDIKIDAASLSKYCKQYGFEKPQKGQLADAALDAKVLELVKSFTKDDIVYIAAPEEWKLNRGALDRVVGRSTRIYYVYKSLHGRVKLANNVRLYQEFDGTNYFNSTIDGGYNAPPEPWQTLQKYE